jgi:tetratricopeptide (TPR) repeat protein
MKHFRFTMLFSTLIAAFSLTLIETAKSHVKPATVTREEVADGLKTAKGFYLDYYEDSINLDRSIEILNDVLKKAPKNLEALVLISRVWLTYGYAKAPNDNEKLRVFKNGIKMAKKAVELAPDDPDAHFFYVANLGSWGETRGVVKSLFLLPEIKKELRLILKLDPDHVYALGMNGLLYYKIPEFMGGDLRLSEIYLRRAIRLDPHLTVLKIHLAKTLLKQNRDNEAKEILEEVIEEKDPTVYADWYFNKEMAKNMIAEIEKKSQRTPPPNPALPKW